MSQVLSDLVNLLALEPIEENLFRGASQDLGFRQLFGGQVLGQSLSAASQTVDEARHVHSLHGYFLRPGDATKPAVYLVDRPRDGGSFCTRRVNAVQNGEVIFSMGASFQTAQDGIEHQDEMPTVVPPDDLDPDAENGLAQFAEWDIRKVPRDKVIALPGVASQQQVWFKHRDPLPDDPLLHICALAYMSDLTLLGSAQVNHPEERPHLMVASLDHAMWFMRPFRTDEWLLYDQSSPSAGGGRALTQGKLFNQRGQMVAAVMQEGLTRYQRGYTPPGR